MKSKIVYALLMVVLFTSGIFAQERFAVGIVGTQFGNLGSENKFSQIENPFGYGVVASYRLSQEFAVALTGEYFKDNMKDIAGKEQDFRGHLSTFISPVSSEDLHPYLSAGIVYTYRKYDYTTASSAKESEGVFNGRVGLGVDYRLVSNFFLNLDLGLYNDGMQFVGWSSSLGFRINTRLF
jgi:hypothetical protein